MSELAKCGSCAAWVRRRNKDKTGNCHAMPPSADRKEYSYYDTVHWPKTHEEDWCMWWAPDRERFVIRVGNVLAGDAK